MPDLHGLSARQAVRALGVLGLRAAFVGDGTVARHRPAAGEVVEPGGAATVWLRRHAAPRGGAEAVGP